MKVVILKYNAGNTKSVSNALTRIGINPVISDNHEIIQTADRVIFPGVGEASSAMAYLRDKKLDQVIKNLKQPVLGICLGLQLLCRHSEENNTDCIGVFDSTVKRFSTRLKVPQIGWNKLNNLRSGLFTGIPSENFMYFVHSYYATISQETIAEADYDILFSAALNKNNFYAVQFHPEKSGDLGECLIKNFIQ